MMINVMYGAAGKPRIASERDLCPQQGPTELLWKTHTGSLGKERFHCPVKDSGLGVQRKLWVGSGQVLGHTETHLSSRGRAEGLARAGG